MRSMTQVLRRRRGSLGSGAAARRIDDPARGFKGHRQAICLPDDATHGPAQR